MLQSGWERKSTTKRFATGRFSPCTWKISSEMRCRVQHSKRKFISTSNHVFFVYHINTTALYWQEKSTFLMNENKRINNPWIRVLKCVDTLKMKTSVESLQKQTVGLIFNIKKKSQLLNWSLPTEKNLSGTRAVANLPAVDFRLRQNRREVASFLYAQPLCIGTWIRDKSFKKIVLTMIPWARIDALRTVIFYEVSILGKTPLGRKLQPPDLCGLKIIKSWIFHFSKQKRSTTGQAIWTLFS